MLFGCDKLGLPTARVSTDWERFPARAADGQTSTAVLVRRAALFGPQPSSVYVYGDDDGDACGEHVCVSARSSTGRRSSISAAVTGTRLLGWTTSSRCLCGDLKAKEVARRVAATWTRDPWSLATSPSAERPSLSPAPDSATFSADAACFSSCCPRRRTRARTRRLSRWTESAARGSVLLSLG